MGPRRRDADVDQVKLGLERIDLARSFFKEAQAYLNEKTHAATNLKYEACKGLFDRSKSLYVNCDLVKEMLAAIHLAAEFNFKLVIVGGTDSWMIGDILKENKVAVILAEPHSLPATDDDAVDQPYKTGAMLQKRVCSLLFVKMVLMDIANNETWFSKLGRWLLMAYQKRRHCKRLP